MGDDMRRRLDCDDGDPANFTGNARSVTSRTTTATVVDKTVVDL